MDNTSKNKKNMGTNKPKPIYSHAVKSVQSHV